MRTPRAWQLMSSATLLAVLAACGGGGGGGGSSNNNATNNNPATDPDGNNQPAAINTRSDGTEKIRLGGIVSKGRLGNANVRVLAINSDGTVNDSAPLATGTTDYQGTADADNLAEGEYKTTEFTLAGAYVVEVSAKPCPGNHLSTTVVPTAPVCSYHQDEELGTAQYLPSGFKIRAVVTATPADNKVNVTLFSELAIRAAIRAAGGTDSAPKLTSPAIAQGQAMVNNLFGTTDLNSVVPKALPDEDSNITLTPTEARLAAMLAAASKIASDTSLQDSDDAAINGKTRLTTLLNSLGVPDAQLPANCLLTGTTTRVSPATPQATQCVLDVLAGNARVGNYVGGNTAVTAQLNDALQNVVSDSGSAELAAVTSTTSDKLTNDSLSVPTPADPTTGLYTTIRSFFMDLVDYARALFNQDQGAPVFAEAHQFENATQAARFEGENLGRTGELMQIGAQLYTAYQQTGRTSDVSKFYRDDGYGNMGRRSPGGRGCWLADASDNVITPGAAADHVICYVNQTYNADFSAGTPTGNPNQYSYPAQMAFHSFTLQPQLNGSSQVTGFTYSGVSLVDPARTVVVNWSSGAAGTDTLGTDLSAQTYSPQRTSATIPADPWSNARAFTGTIANLTYTNNKGYLKSITIHGDLPDMFKSGHTVPLHDTGDATTNLAKSTMANVTITVVSTTYDANDKVVDPGEVNFAGTLTSTLADGNTLDVAMVFTNGDMTIVNQQLDSVRFDVLTHNNSASFKASVSMARQFNDGIQIDEVQGAVYNNATASGTPFIQATLTGNNDRSHYSGGARTDSNYELATLTFDGFVRAPNKPKIRVSLTGAIKLTTPGSPQFGLNTTDAISGDYFIYNSDDSLKRDVTFTFRSPDTSNGSARVLTDIVDPTNKVAFSFGYTGNNGSNLTNTGDTTKADTWANVLVNKVVHAKLDTHASPLPTVYMDNGNYFSLDTGTIRY